MIASITHETRQKLKLTQSAFGAAIDVQKQHISIWEHGRQLPSISFLLMTAIKYQDWRREWALQCLDAHPDLAQARSEKETPAQIG